MSPGRFTEPAKGPSKGQFMPCKTCSARAGELCGFFPDSTIERLYVSGKRIAVQRGDYLFMDDAPSNYIYNVAEGTCMLERIGSDGRRQVVAFCYPGDFIGLTAGPSYTLSAKALSNGHVCRWSLKDLDVLFEAEPNLQKRLRHIASRVLAVTIDQLFVLGRMNATEKIAFFIIQTQARQQRLTHPSPIVHLPMTRSDIADHLGLTIETTSRAISKLVRQGMINLNAPHKIEINDQAALRAIAGV
jgi:CRP/FNR family transcriptional regulator